MALLALSFVGSVNTFSQVSFTAQVSGHQVVQNGIFDIQFELSNAEGTDFQPPSFADFKVVGGPSRGQSMTSINGAVTSSETYSYSLLATKNGKFTIGSASIVAGRKKLTTKPITIEVVAGRIITKQGNGSPPSADVLLEAETEQKDYYPGEQIVLNYRILFNQNIQTLDILAEDDYADFFVQNFSEFSKQPAIVKMNGKEYTSRIIKSIALYPHQSGTYVIDPLVMSVGINAPFSGIQGFFTMRRMQDVRIASDSLKINVLPLPPGEPATFHGAVGQYTIKTYPGPEAITTDDALTFQVELRGNGDAKRWDPPTVIADSTFESYDPRITDDQQMESGGIMVNRRSIEYQLIPKTAGTFRAWVPFTYFDPDTKRYVTLTSDTITVRVSQGTNKARRSIANQESDSTTFEIDPVRRSILKDMFWMSWLHWLLFGLVITGSCWGFVHASKTRKEERISQKEKARNAAAANAISQLDELLKASASLDAKTYYERVTEVFYRFLCHRLMIPSSDLDEAKLPGHLKFSQVENDLCSRVMKLYQACLPVRYGGAPAGFSREEFVEECKGIIRSL
ncbi:MAG TPA: BatD family protein [Saprospiraceae bacterium]|nr:BatD family protein [Saprospiraceae bacterium]